MNTRNSFNISVIVTFFNDGKYIDNIVRNIEFLHSHNIIKEIIIWDDGSSSNHKFDGELFSNFSKVRCSGNSENLGLLASRLLALREAKSDFIWFIDSDDEVIFIPEINYSDLAVYDFFGKPENTDSTTYEIGMKVDLRKEIINDLSTCVAWNKVFKRSLFNEIKYNNFRNGDDIYLLFYALKNSKSIIHIETPLMNYILRSDSLSRKYKFGRLFELSRVIKELRNLRLIRFIESYKLFYNYIIKNYIRSIVKYRNPLVFETIDLVRSFKCLL